MSKKDTVAADAAAPSDDLMLTKLFDALMMQNIETSDESYLILKCVGVPPRDTEFVSAIRRVIDAHDAAAQCCDTPAYCSSVRRCTAKDAQPDERAAFEAQWNYFLESGQHESDAYLMGWKVWQCARATAPKSKGDAEDAARYRWLRSTAIPVQTYASGNPNWLFGGYEFRGATFDAAIDRARAMATPQAEK